MGKRESLNDYLKRVNDIPFEWGIHDCFTFTNNAFKEMYGQGWADDWVGRYMSEGKPLRRRELMKEFGFGDFNKAVDQKLTRVNYYPPLGCLVTTKKSQRWITGVAMGLSTGAKGVFLSKDGLIYLPLTDVEQAWTRDG